MSDPKAIVSQGHDRHVKVAIHEKGDLVMEYAEDIPFPVLMQRHRKRAGLTQSALAERTGCVPNYVSKIEQGIRTPHAAMVTHLADALGLTGPERDEFATAARRLATKRAIPSGDFPQPVAPPRPILLTHVPRQWIPLVGREAERDDAIDWLRRPESRLLVLTGPVGIGKTSLSLGVATAISSDFRDGIAFVDLTPLNAGRQVMATLAQQLGAEVVKDAASLAVLDALVGVLAKQQILIIFDGFEAVLDAAPDLIALLNRCPDVKMLVTSRIALPIRSAQHLQVGPLALPSRSTTTPEAALRSPTIALFVSVAQRMNPTFCLSAGNVPAIVAICHLLDGLPLAIELMASRTHIVTPMELLEDLLASTEHRVFDILTHELCDLSAHQQSLDIAITRSYMLMASTEQMLLRWIAAFPGGCTRSALTCVGVIQGVMPDAIDRGLATLRTANLLNQDEAGNGEQRIVLLWVVREYALARLQQAGETTVIQAAIAAYYTRYFQQVHGELRNGSDAIPSTGEYENFKAVVQWAKLSEMPVCAFETLWQLDIDAQKTGTVLRQMFTVNTQIPPTAAELQSNAGALGELGKLAGHHQAYELGAILSQASCDLYKRLDDRNSVAWHMTSIARHAIDSGAYDRAEAAIDETISIWRHRQDAVGVASSLLNFGAVDLCRGNWQTAIERIQEILGSINKGNDPFGHAWALTCFGDALLMGGEAQKALVVYQTALPTYKEVSEDVSTDFGINYTLHCMGQAARIIGDLASAHAWFTATIAARLATYIRLGLVEDLQPPSRAIYLAQARRHLRDAITLFLAIQEDRRFGDALPFFAATAVDSLALRRTLVRYREAWITQERDRRQLGDGAVRYLDGLPREGELRQLEAHYQRTLELQYALGTTIRVVECLEGLARLTPDLTSDPEDLLREAAPLPPCVCSRYYGSLLALCERLSVSSAALRHAMGPPITPIDHLREHGSEGFVYLLFYG